MSEPEFRDYRPEDAPAVEAIWGRVFGAARGGQTLDWLFRPGPAGDAVRAVAEIDGQVVGHAGVSALRFQLGGEEVRGGYSVGAMTDPDFQGRGLFVSLGRYLYARMEQLGFAFVAGFSNRNSHRLMTGPLGRCEVRPFPWCVRPLVPRLRAPGPGDAGAEQLGGYRVERRPPGDPALDGIWQRAAPGVRLGAVRDSAFCAWRYGTRPDADYVCLVAEGAAGPAAFAVLRMLTVRGLRFGFVVDLVAGPQEPRAARALLQGLARCARSKGAIGLSALLPGEGTVRRALRRAGFLRVPEALHPQLIRFSVRGLGRFAGRPELVDPRAWWLSWSDTDVV